MDILSTSVLDAETANPLRPVRRGPYRAGWRAKAPPEAEGAMTVLG